MASQLIGRFWNGRWGHIARRDIWLRRHTEWIVEARHGDSDAPTKQWEFPDEDAARAWIAHLIAKGGDGWRETTSLYGTSPGPRRRPDTEDDVH